MTELKDGTAAFELADKRKINFTVGGESYAMDELPLFQSRKWRKDLSTLIQDVGPKMTLLGSNSNVNTFMDNMGTAFCEVPERMLDLVAKYDVKKKLPWDRLKKQIYGDELDDLFIKVMDVVFPLSRSLARAMGLVTQESPSQ